MSNEITNQAIELSSEELDVVAGGAIDLANLFNANDFKNEKLVTAQVGSANGQGAAGGNALAAEETKSNSLQNIFAIDFPS